MASALEVLQTIAQGHIYLLPVRIDECRIPDRLAAIHCVDLFPDYEAGLRKIISALKFQRDLQAKARAGDFDPSGSKGHSVSVLLINDEPSTMNALKDHLKSFGLSVSHAFNVPQAIKFIHDNNPDVIISDLSHFSFGTQVTDRAAFEILEWGMRNHNALKVIVTAAEITNKRREEAKRLGAIGICKDAANLCRHLSAATGVEIPNPFPPDPEDVNHDTGTKTALLCRSGSRSPTAATTRRLTAATARRAASREPHPGAQPARLARQDPVPAEDATAARRARH
jgi:CheY-like chemotaxis protein